MEWHRIPDDLCLRLVEVAWPAGICPTSEIARERLMTEVPELTGEFMKRGAPGKTVAHAVRDVLPELNGVRTAFLRAEDRGLVERSTPRIPSEKAMLRHLKGCRMQSGLRDILLQALRDAGAATRENVDGGSLQPLMVIRTKDPLLGKELLPHQHKVVGDLRAEWAATQSRMLGLVVMPTGSGKTRTAVDWLLSGPVGVGYKVLWLTHSSFLLEQTAATFVARAPLARRKVPEVIVRLIGAGYSSATSLAGAGQHVTIATVQSFTRRRTLDHLRAWLREHDVVVIVDEAHHGVARTWRALVNLAKDETDDAVVGLTATPVRYTEESTDDLARLFGANVISQVTAPQLVEQGVLARPTFHTVPTECNLTPLLGDDAKAELEQWGDFSPRILGQLVNNAPRNNTIVETYLAGPDGTGETFGQAIVYAVNVAHAKTLEAMFERRGITCEAVYGSRGRNENADALARFRSGDVAVLVNVELLTEGVDAPEANAVLLARPTLSLTLFSQMVGRVLRGPKVGGTAQAHVVDFRDLLEVFGDWQVDFAELRLLEGLPAEEPEPSEATALVPYELDALVEMAVGISDLFPPMLGGAAAKVPVGYYLLGADPGRSRVDAEPLLRPVLVFKHDAVGYQRIVDAIETGDRKALDDDWSQFFDDISRPRPAPQTLTDLRATFVANGELPQLVLFENVDALDPVVIAQGMIARGIRAYDEVLVEVRALHADHSTIVDRIWGGVDALIRDVKEEWTRIIEGRPVPIEDRRIRSVIGAGRQPWVFEDGGIDLTTVMSELLDDQRLFPYGLEPPAGGIRWTKPRQSYWAQYDSERERIYVNRWLDSRNVVGNRDYREVLRFLVFHELLHHEQLVDGRWSDACRLWGGHPAEFYVREHSFEGFVRHDAFLDEFSRRFEPRAA